MTNIELQLFTDAGRDLGFDGYLLGRWLFAFGLNLSIYKELQMRSFPIFLSLCI